MSEKLGTLTTSTAAAVPMMIIHTKLYDRRGQKVLLEDMERIRY
jgi:hypothetical protein